MLNQVRPSPKEADSAGLCFDSGDDALDHACKCVEDGNRWLAAHNLDIAHRYEEGDLDIVLNVHTRLDAHELHLVFRAIPPRHADAPGTADLKTINVRVAHRHGDGLKDLMFIGVTQLVQGPEQIIPSLVWLERPQQRQDFVRNVLAPALDHVFEVRSGISKREGGLDSLTPDGGHGRGVAGTVQRSAQVDHGIGSDVGQCDWHGLHELDLVNLLSSVRVRLNDSGVWVCTEKGSNLPVKIASVMLGAIDAGS